MKNIKFLILIVLFLLTSEVSEVSAQDAIFTQWKNMSLHTNPSLTGDFEGDLRIRTKYRDQWTSILGNREYRTGAASFEYKFNNGKMRKISIGAHTILDKAGLLAFNSYNISTAVTQSLGRLDASHHEISLGFNMGLANKSIEIDETRWPSEMVPDNLEEKIRYLDYSVGLNWKYISETRFQMQFGSGMFHINRPNISLFNNGTSRINYRYTVHGNAEIPLSTKMSLIPSFLYYNQGHFNQLLFGVASKIYIKSNETNFFEIGVHAKTTQNLNGSDINVFVMSTMIELKSILLGFSIDRFQDIGSNAYEFSLGYVIGK